MARVRHGYGALSAGGEGLRRSFMAEERTRLLLIEHDGAFARYVGEMLGQARNLPIEMRTAEDLDSGLGLLIEESFDAVVLDLCVPDGAGLANIPLIQGLVPNLAVVVAGEVDDDILALEAMHSGAQDYLVKGQLTAGWLERAIRYAIERQRMDVALLAAEEKYTAFSTIWSKAFSRRHPTDVT